MISIIVSSYKQGLFETFSTNVAKTIGNIPFELIQIWNPGLMGICEAYNKGAAQATFPYLVFAHEDILFRTNHWGNILIKTFEHDPEIGLVGVLGSKYKAYIYSGWASGFGTYSQMIHNADGLRFYSKKVNDVATSLNLLERDEADAYSYVANDLHTESVTAIDGMFMATTAKVFADIRFDQHTFRHFHCYDIDYSLQVFKKYKVVVSYNILIEHFSSGTFDNNWLENTKLLHNKWLNVLPVYNLSLNKKQLYTAEYGALIRILPILAANSFAFFNVLSQIYSKNFIRLLGLFHWLSFQFIAFLKILKHSIKKIFS